MKDRVLIMIGIGILLSFSVLDSFAEEFYFEADFDFFNEHMQEDRKYHLGDTIYVVGHSSLYKEETDEHFPSSDSKFHVIIKNPKNMIIHEEDYVSDDTGKIEFPCETHIFHFLKIEYPISKIAMIKLKM